MNAKEFFYLVANMRAAQKSYFKNRTPQGLRAARALEGDVDREIARVKECVYNFENHELPKNNQCED